MDYRILPILAAAVLQGCATAEPMAGSQDAYRPSVARALSYYEGSDRRYLLSAPVQSLPGRLSVCTREEIDDGRGGKAAGTMTHFIVEGGRIVESFADHNCMYRNYGPLEPVKR